ncbi:MAG: hypothetical protein DMF88_11190 [Acidobacteria bacterium]|nr:MAG: hypothetical protein DMF88_11190 [Acidobacteriota bacterium]
MWNWTAKPAGTGGTVVSSSRQPRALRDIHLRDVVDCLHPPRPIGIRLQIAVQTGTWQPFLRQQRVARERDCDSKQQRFDHQSLQQALRRRWL